jgi:hypothetical protein
VWIERARREREVKEVAQKKRKVRVKEERKAKEEKEKRSKKEQQKTQKRQTTTTGETQTHAPYPRSLKHHDLQPVLHMHVHQYSKNQSIGANCPHHVWNNIYSKSR